MGKINLFLVAALLLFMKVVNILGGLGNQMFQYAFAIGLQSAFPQEIVKLNISAFKGYPLHNGFELDTLFKIKLPFASKKDLLDVAYPWYHYRLWQIGLKLLPRRKSMSLDVDYYAGFDYNQVKDKSYFDGYWQSPKFFDKYRGEILKAFRFPDFTDLKNEEAVKFIESGRTAFIHVRRGDYVNHPLFKGICDEKYYYAGITALIYKYKFNRILIFSNDIKWCRTNLSVLFEDIPHKYVDWNKGKESYRDMQLMSHCKGALIANSTFSWWGAWLNDNPEKIVIAPHKWINIDNEPDIIPDSWIKMIQ